MSDLINENNSMNEENSVADELVQEVLVETPAVDTEEVKVEEPSVDAVEEDNSVISMPSVEPTPVQVLGNVNGAIGTTTATPEPKTAPAKKAKKSKQDTVAIHSTKNVTWPGVGKVYVGYNIVDKNESEKWLTRSHVRLATPAEVAKEFGK